MFKKAERKSAKLRAALCGTSGSGKTYSALLLARGLAGPSGKIAVIDTERGSASLYADVTDFDVAELTPPYSPARYKALITAAAKEYDVLIIDSITHEWSGEGGVLEMHDKATAAEPGRNSYTAWKNVTPHHTALVDAILAAPCHIIATMRSKTAYEIQDNGRGKKAPVKIGTAPIQKEGMEYEFTLVLDVSVEGNVATASKDRTRLWHQRNEVITTDHGMELRKWLESGAPVVDVEPAPWRIPDDLVDALWRCTDYAECKVWLAQSRQTIGITDPGDPRYLEMQKQAAARVKQLADQTITVQAPEPELEPELEAIE